MTNQLLWDVIPYRYTGIQVDCNRGTQRCVMKISEISHMLTCSSQTPPQSPTLFLAQPNARNYHYSLLHLLPETFHVLPVFEVSPA